MAELLLDPAQAAKLGAYALEFARHYHERQVRTLAEVVRSPAGREP